VLEAECRELEEIINLTDTCVMVRLSKSHNKAIDVIQKTIGERLAKTAHIQMHENLHTQIWFPVSFVRNK